MPSSPSTPTATPRLGGHLRAWAAVALIALGTRALLVSRTDPARVMTHWSNVGDATLYDTFGWNLASRGVLGVGSQPSAFVMPGYPVLLAGVYGLAGHVPGAVRWAQVVLGAAAVLMLGAFAARVRGTRAGLLVAVIAAVYPYFLYFVPELLTETAFLFCSAGMLLAAKRLGDEGRLRDGLFFGACFTWAVMTRSVALILLPGLLVLARPWTLPARASRLAALAIAFVMLAGVWGGWVLRNQRALGTPVLFDTHGGFTLYTGQLISMGVPHAEVVRRTKEELGYYRYDIERGTLPGGPAAEVEADRRATARAKALMRNDVRGYVARIPENLAALWLNLDFDKVAGKKSWSLIAIAGWASFVPLALLGFAGLWTLWRERKVAEMVALVWILAATTVLHGLTHGGKRYRAAVIDPILICAAGLQLDAWGRRGEERPKVS